MIRRSLTVLIGAFGLWPPGAALGQVTCKEHEYARLKDSTRSELTKEYCSATRAAKLHEDLSAIQREGSARDRREADRSGERQITCMRAADEVARMLRLKFKVKTPSCT